MKNLLLTSVLVGLIAIPTFGNPTAFSLDDANARRHFQFLDDPSVRTATEDTSDPWGYGFAGTMTVKSVSGLPYDHEYLLEVANVYIPENTKFVWLEYIWKVDGDGGIAPPNNALLHGCEDDGIFGNYSFAQEDLGEGKYKATIEWSIKPQPSEEWFKWQTAGDWRLLDVKVATTCIPAPGAVLLGSIGVGLVGWLRRRKKL